MDAFTRKLVGSVLELYKEQNKLLHTDAELEYFNAIDTDISKKLNNTLESLKSLANQLSHFKADQKNLEFQSVDDVFLNYKPNISDISDSFIDDVISCLDDDNPHMKTIQHSISENNKLSITRANNPSNRLNEQSKQSLSSSNTSIPHPPSQIEKQQKKRNRNEMKKEDQEEGEINAKIKKQENKFNNQGGIIRISKQDQNVFVHKIHPFQDLIKSLDYSNYYIPIDDVKFKSTEETPYKWIETESELINLISDLKKETIISVDVEHHNLHSYHGLVCLIQISTCSMDFLIDSIKLYSKLVILNEIFANPNILKVMHGCESDVKWLQRDFNVFLVNVFDTFFASRFLAREGERNSLAQLLDTHLNIKLDKQYQLADWRIRPLSPEMIHYARSDTRYLPFLFCKLLEKLREKDPSLVESVFKSSSNRCLYLYPSRLSTGNNNEIGIEGNSDPMAWKSLIEKSTVPYSPRELDRLKAIYNWRDEIARLEDESLISIMSNTIIIRIAQDSSIDPSPILRMERRINMSFALKHLKSLSEALLKVQSKYELLRKSREMNLEQNSKIIKSAKHTRFNSEEDEENVNDKKEQVSPSHLPLVETDNQLETISTRDNQETINSTLSIQSNKFDKEEKNPNGNNDNDSGNQNVTVMKNITIDHNNDDNDNQKSKDGKSIKIPIVKKSLNNTTSMASLFGISKNSKLINRERSKTMSISSEMSINQISLLSPLSSIPSISNEENEQSISYPLNDQENSSNDTIETVSTNQILNMEMAPISTQSSTSPPASKIINLSENSCNNDKKSEMENASNHQSNSNDQYQSIVPIDYTFLAFKMMNDKVDKNKESNKNATNSSTSNGNKGKNHQNKFKSITKTPHRGNRTMSFSIKKGK